MPMRWSLKAPSNDLWSPAPGALFNRPSFQMRRIVACLFVALASSCCAAPLRVLPIGDSFTAGRNQSYLEPLSALLQRDGIEHEFVGRACELLVPKHPSIAPIVGCSSMRGHQAFWGWTASDVLHGRPGTSLGKLDGKRTSRRASAHCMIAFQAALHRSFLRFIKQNGSRT